MRTLNNGVQWWALLVFGICLTTAQLAAQTYGTKPSSQYRGLKKSTWSAQAVAYNFALARVATESEKLVEMIPDGQPHEQLTNIISNARFLKNRWSQWINRNGSDYVPGRDRYLEDLKHNFELVKRARDSDKPEERDEFIEIVDMDMQIKADNCRNAGDGLGKTVVVTVTTKKGAASVGGFQVWYVPRGLYSVEAEHDHFNQISSPTESIHLPPGGYLMWGVKGETKTEPAVYRVGGRGLAEVQIDVVIP
jgi:hypothetical protein